MGVTIENSWHSMGGLWQDNDLFKVKSGFLKYQPVLIATAVKFQETISPGDFLSMEKAFGKGDLITKSQSISRVLSKAIPLEHFLQCQ